MFANYFLFTLFIIVSGPIFAEDAIPTSLKYTLLKLARDGNPLAEIRRPGPGCSDHVKFLQCGNMESQIAEDYDRAFVLINRLRSQVDTYFGRKEIQGNDKLIAELRAVAGMLNCIYGKYHDVSIECTSNHGGKDIDGKQHPITPFKYAAYVTNQPLSNGKIYIPNLITIGSAYYFYSNENRAGILIHELSHMCGAQDLEYFLQKTSVEGKVSGIPYTRIKGLGHPSIGYKYFGETGSSATNADNFRWWAINGFCIPKFDCVEIR